MKQSTPVTTFSTIVLATSFFAGYSLAASADRVFPPHHLHQEAKFNPGAKSTKDVNEAWYRRASTETRARVFRNEVQQESPLSFREYFARLRTFGNPTPYFDDPSQDTAAGPSLEIADDGRISNDDS